MSAILLKLAAILCLSCTALSASACSGVLWGNIGESIAIECRTSEPDPKNLTVSKGLNADIPVVLTVDRSDETIATNFTERLEIRGTFPNMDIHIHNLVLEDTGVYWCLYNIQPQSAVTTGTQSVLLVTREKVALVYFNSLKEDLILMSVVISTGTILGIIMIILIWLIKTKTVTTSREDLLCVYEDMRGGHMLKAANATVEPRHALPINIYEETVNHTDTKDVLLQTTTEP